MSQTLVRFGTEFEPADVLENLAHRAQDQLGIHGVSVVAIDRVTVRTPASFASRLDVEASGFPVHDTPTRRNPHHKTVELPHPVTVKVAERFNQVFGRQR